MRNITKIITLAGLVGLGYVAGLATPKRVIEYTKEYAKKPQQIIELMRQECDYNSLASNEKERIKKQVLNEIINSPDERSSFLRQIFESAQSYGAFPTQTRAIVTRWAVSEIVDYPSEHLEEISIIFRDYCNYDLLSCMSLTAKSAGKSGYERIKKVFR
ncbi:MAG: hypothetical protein QXK37_02725 [Candidatus Woesearchaeota archaeon]